MSSLKFIFQLQPQIYQDFIFFLRKYQKLSRGRKVYFVCDFFFLNICFSKINATAFGYEATQDFMHKKVNIYTEICVAEIPPT